MELLIYRALIQLEKTSPDLYFLIKKAKIEVSTDEKLTAYCTIEKNQFKIVLGESFIKDFNEFSLAALIEHESLHIVFEHLTRTVFSELKGQDRTLANIAQDAIINELGLFLSQRKKLNEKLQKGIWIETINEKLAESKSNVRVCQFTHSSLDILEILKKELKKEKQDELKNQCFDDHLKESNEDMSEIIDLDNNETLKAIEGLLNDSKKAGSKTGQALLSGLIKKKKDKSFSKEVNKFLGSCLVGEKQPTSKRLSRRFIGQKGKKEVEKPKILLGIDTSGSMLDEETIKKMQLIVSKSLGLGLEVSIVFGDTEKKGIFHSIKNHFDFSSIRGGGGTELSFIFNEFKKSNYNGLIVLTDAEFDHNSINTKKAETLFVFTEKNQESQKIEKKFRGVYV